MTVSGEVRDMLDRREMLSGTGAALAVGLASGLRAAPVAAPPAALTDMAVLRSALTLHPGLNRYRSPAAIERGITSLEKSWSSAPELEKRYLALSRFLASIRCGHSYANFFNQRKAVATALYDRPTRLPLHFIWVGEAMVVTDGFGSGLPRGTLVRRINGERPAVLRERLMPLVRADGHNDSKRISLLEVRGDDEVETFDVFQGLVAPPPGGVHRLAVTLPDGREWTLDLPGIGLAERKAQMPTRPDASDGPVWEWREGKDGIVVLTMPGWALYDSKWDWKTWLNDRLDGLGTARGLIVDLRDNEGGVDCGDLILARLIERDFIPPQIEQRLRFRRTPAALDRYLDTWDDSFRSMGERAAPLPGGFFLRPSDDDPLRITRAARAITCPVRVLTSPVNSSATFQFASNFRAIGKGKLVGRSTGGNRRGINGGAFFFVRLPDSGIEFDLPLVGYYPLIPQPDAGIVPDIVAADTIASLRAGEDFAMAAAVASIRAG